MNRKYLVTGLTLTMLAAVILWGCDNAHHGEHMDEGPKEGHGGHMEDAGTEHHGNTTQDHEHADHEMETAETTKDSKTETAEESSLSGNLKNGVRVVTVKARKFEFDPARIIVEKGEKLRLKVTSEDVAHGIGIPAFDITRTLKPEKTEVIEFQPDKAGTYHFHCTIYCGSGHDQMHGELVVRESDED